MPMPAFSLNSSYARKRHEHGSESHFFKVAAKEPKNAPTSYYLALRS